MTVQTVLTLITLLTVMFAFHRTGKLFDELLSLRNALTDVRKTASEAHRRCTEALKSKTEHEARIRELYERCNSLQAQINNHHWERK